MASIERRHTELIDAPRDRCLERLLDVRSYPAWYDTLDAVDVLSQDAAGRVASVRFAVEVPRATIRIELRLDYALPDRIRATQTGGNGHIRDFASEWRLDVVDPERTRADYAVTAHSGNRSAAVMFRAARHRIEHGLVDAFPQALKAAVEGDRGVAS